MLGFRGHHRTQVKLLAVKRLGVISILIALAYAGFETVWPVLLEKIFIEASTIGFITSALSIISLISFVFFVPLFEKIHAKTLFFISIAVNAILFVFFSFTRDPFWFLVIAISNSIFFAIRMQAFGILLRDNSSSKTINKNESKIFIALNLGWLIGPLIAGFMAQSFGAGLVFIYSAFLILIATHIYAFTTFNEHKAENQHINIWKNMKEFFSKKDLRKAYYINLGVEFWWMIPYIFVPIEIIKAGLGEVYLGIFLFALVIPLILVEYLIKRREIEIPKKTLLTIGYFFMALTSIAIFFAPNIYALSGLVVMGSFGMGLIEPTVEGLFFSVTKQKEERKFYGPYATAKTLGAFLSKFGIATILLFLPLKYGILYVGLIMFILSRVSKKLKKKY